MHFVNPESLPEPRGYNNAVRSGPFLFISGQVAFDRNWKVQAQGDVVRQFDIALGHVLTVLKEGGGAAHCIVRMTIYVKDIADYKSKAKEIGKVYREKMGKHYPAMSCVEVSNLYDDGALVEIETTAIL